MQYRCECGAVQYSIPLTGCSVFNTDVMDSILNAAPGATVHYSTTRWISFHKAVGDSLAKRPDITLVVDFLSGGYRGVPMQFTIPAGTDIAPLFNEEGYAGFLFPCRKIRDNRGQHSTARWQLISGVRHSSPAVAGN